MCQAQTSTQYTITTIAGQLGEAGGYTGDGGAAASATLFGPDDVIFDSAGNLYISDSINDLIREVNASGSISTFAGNCPTTPCTGAFAGDGGAATKASLNSPSGMTFDSSSNFYIADTDNFEIRKMTGGTISTVAGHNGLGASFAGDLGAATSAGLWNPSGVAVDPAGNIYIADAYNNVVRVVCQTQTPTACTNNAFVGGVVWAAGDINTFAGNNATGAGYQGDGGIATGSLLNNPAAVLLDSQGNLYISDSGNSAIRKVAAATSIITTVAGDGSGIAGYSGDGGSATKAKLSNPKGIAIDSSGNLYIADTGNCLVRMVNATTGNITTIAGTPPVTGQLNCGSSGDKGLSTSAQLNFPSGVAVKGGLVYIADFENNAVRLLTPAAAVPQISAGGVVNDANYTAPVVPGSIAAVFGDFFLTAGSSNTTLPLATNLQNLSFQFGDTFILRFRNPGEPASTVGVGRTNFGYPHRHAEWRGRRRPDRDCRTLRSGHLHHEFPGYRRGRDPGLLVSPGGFQQPGDCRHHRHPDLLHGAGSCERESTGHRRARFAQCQRTGAHLHDADGEHRRTAGHRIVLRSGAGLCGTLPGERPGPGRRGREQRRPADDLHRSNSRDFEYGHYSGAVSAISYSLLTPIAMMEVGGHGRRLSMRRHSQTSRSKTYNWKRLMVFLFSTRPVTYQAGREMRLKSRIRSTRKPTCSIFCRSSSRE
jgi:sugar lactone lactonase YvrE